MSSNVNVTLNNTVKGKVVAICKLFLSQKSDIFLSLYFKKLHPVD